MTHEEQLARSEALYEKVKQHLDDVQQKHVAKLREEKLAGDRYSMYGHDLWSAVSKGFANGERAKAAELLNLIGERPSRPTKPESFAFAMALSALVDSSLIQGNSVDSIRTRLLDAANATDALGLESRAKHLVAKG